LKAGVGRILERASSEAIIGPDTPAGSRASRRPAAMCPPRHPSRPAAKTPSSRDGIAS